MEQGCLAEQVMIKQEAFFSLLSPDQSETVSTSLQVIGVRGVMDNMVRVNTDNNENESAGLDDHLGRCQQGLYCKAKT